VIQQVNKKPVKNAEDFKAKIENSKTRKPFSFSFREVKAPSLPP